VSQYARTLEEPRGGSRTSRSRHGKRMEAVEAELLARSGLELDPNIDAWRCSGRRDIAYSDGDEG